MKTIRQEMIALLEAGELSARDLSRCLGIREKEVYAHLGHIARSIGAQGKKVVIRPSRCLNCGFVFHDRRRFTRPGRCPRCKDTRLETPLFRIG
ncbi:MAG: transcriptional regulator [Desulfobacterales bacterium]